MAFWKIGGAVALSVAPGELGSLSRAGKFLALSVEPGGTPKMWANAAFANLPGGLPADVGVSPYDLAYARAPALPAAFTVYRPDANAPFWADHCKR